jgi:hypothetical protein
MHKSLMKRFATTRFTTYMLIAALTTLAGCSKLCTPTKPVTAVQANLIVSGVIGDCNYQASSANQSVYIDIKGTSTNNSSYSWTQTLASVTSSTYPVQAPDQGTFKVTVIVTEAGGITTCSTCQTVCSPAVTTTPRWRGNNNFTGTTAAGNTLNVTVELPKPPTKEDCGC